ncbi:hypothetical protein AMK68_04380, partial [candidate division KD3-62 bacterium DG_56]
MTIVGLDQVRESQLDNGLTVLLKPVPGCATATCWIWYRVGSRCERPGITGASHWVEHMLFKGTERFRPGQIMDEVARRGGYCNGFTWTDYTVYFETLPAEHLELGLEIEADRMVNARFDAQDVDSERTVIISEREGAENEPEYLLSEAVIASAFQVHPYRFPVVGWKCDLRAMTRDELEGYYRQFYAPNNAVLVLVGDFDPTEALARAQARFSGIPRGPEIEPIRAIEPEQEGERRVTVRRPGGTAYLIAAFHTPAGEHEDTIPLLVLSAVLNGAPHIGMSGEYLGRSARLYRALVDTGLAASTGAHFPLTVDPHLLECFAVARTGAELAALESALFRELQRLASDPVSAEEFDKAIRQTQAQMAYASDGVTSQAYALGRYHLVSSYRYLDTLAEGLPRVTPEDVQRVAAHYLSENNRTAGWFIPTEPSDAGGVGEVSAHAHFFATGVPSIPSATTGAGPSEGAHLDFPIIRETLDNGAALLMSPNSRTPAIAVHGSVNAGAVADGDQPGLAQMTARLLRRGTESRTARQIAEEAESVGASIEFGAGREEAHFGAKCLPEDLPGVLELVADCLVSPVFPADQVELVRGQMLTEIDEREDSTRSRAHRELQERLFPSPHPYHAPTGGYRESVEQITRDGLVTFHRSHYDGVGAVVTVAGALDPLAVRAAVADTIGRLPHLDAATPEIPPVPDQPPAQRVDIPMPHKFQCDIALGDRSLVRDDPDYYALNAANLILGRLGLNGRLGRVVRETLGLAYYSLSHLDAWRWAGRWLAFAGVNADNIERAIDAIRAEMTRIAHEPVTDEELADARNHWI